MHKPILFILLLSLVTITTNASELVVQSEFERLQSEIKYSSLNFDIQGQKKQDTETGEINYNGGTEKGSVSYKSPGKAFAMSLLIPGWGQYYNGSSKLKSLGFLGAEVTSWFLYMNWQSDADDLTDEYEKFNNEHWIKSRYQDMLDWTYPDRDANPGLHPELSHHLPETQTQQYYEMTGKYDQFSWGWDDAILLSDSSVYGDYSLNNPFSQLNTPENIPYSANRDTYETMRNNANNKYDQARKMIYVSMVNRMLSAFEALIVAKKNNKNSNGSSFLTSMSAKTELKSLYVKRDTPYITLSMKF